MPPKQKSPEELRTAFTELVAKSISDQCQFFLKSFIFALGDKWKDVLALQEKFQKYLKDSKAQKEELDFVQTSDFLQKEGLERDATERKEEVRDIDLDNNNMICFIEYLILHYKAMILTEYYKRVEKPCPHDLSRGGRGVKGVGEQLLDELFTMPMGMDPEVEAAIEEFMAAKKARKDKMDALTTQAEAGGVKGLKAQNELEQMAREDPTGSNRLELTLKAAQNKASKNSGEAALIKKKEAEEKAAAEARAKSKAALAEKAKLFAAGGK